MFESKNNLSTNVNKSNPFINFHLRSFLLPGMNAVVQKLIDESDTAAHYGVGSLGHLIATPAFVALMIDAAVMAVEDRLPPGIVTVGRAFNFKHDAPTCFGMVLRVKATLKEINGDRLLFDIVASDDYGEIGSGTHERAVVDRTSLFAKADERINRV
jgi:fluoroacetyl-CoA thioesterase